MNYEIITDKTIGTHILQIFDKKNRLLHEQIVGKDWEIFGRFPVAIKPSHWEGSKEIWKEIETNL